jgi:hypothetical protein
LSSRYYWRIKFRRVGFYVARKWRTRIPKDHGEEVEGSRAQYLRCGWKI